MPDDIVAPAENELNEVSMLAVRAKDDPALMADLWNAVQNLIKLWAYKYAQRSIIEQGTRSFDTDDLMQSGYFALVKAVAGYEPDKGFAFTSYLNFHIRSGFAEVAGRRGGKQRPELYAVSLDAPISEDDDTCAGELLADPNAEFEEKIIERMAVQQACSDLLNEIAKLPEDQRNVMLLTAWRGMSYQHTCIELNITFKQLRSRKATAVQRVKHSDTGKRIESALNLGDPFRDERSRRYKTSFTRAIGLAAILSKRGEEINDTYEVEKSHIRGTKAVVLSTPRN